MDAKTKAQLICDTLVAKKAYDVLKIDVHGKTVLADYFIIASGKSLACRLRYGSGRKRRRRSHS